MQLLRSRGVRALATIALISTVIILPTVLAPSAAVADGDPHASSAPSEAVPGEALSGADWLADAELLAERLVAEDGNTAPTDEAAKAVRLADVLVDVVTTTARLDVVRAYWDLWATEATLNYRTTELERIDRIVADLGRAPDWLAAVQAKWQALVETAGNDVAVAQQQLASVSPSTASATTAAVTAIDAPHVGPYRTEFERLFSGRPVAGYMFLLQQTMPPRHRALAARGVAVDGTVAMVLDSEAAIREGSDTSDALAWRLEQLRRQRASFVELVRRYNHDIARYALSVAPEDVTIDQVVGMLVLGVSGQANSSEPAAGNVTSGDATTGDAPPHQFLGGTGATTLVTKPGEVAYNLLPARPHFAPNTGADSAGADPANSLTGPGGSVGPKRVVEVARTLFAGDTSDAAGQAISLGDSLAQAGSDRMTVVTNYWWAATAAARHRAMKGLLSELVAPSEQPFRGDGDDGAAGRDALLGWAYFAQLADVFEAEIDSLTAIDKLVATSRWQGSADLRTTTTPHAGRYRTKAERQANWQTNREEIEQLAGQVNDTYQALDLRATLYVDALRAGAISTTSAVSGPDAVVRAWQRRHDTVDDFLAALVDYNVAIGQFVLAVLPQDEPTDDLVTTLVVSAK